MSVSGEVETAGKKITLPVAVMAVTNLTSGYNDIDNDNLVSLDGDSDGDEDGG